MAFGGFIEDTNIKKYDSQYGKPLSWMKIWIPDNNGNGKFELVDQLEPRTQKTPNTGELRDTILSQSPIFLFCARNSESISDIDDNFTYDMPENDIRQAMNLMKHIDEKNIAISDLQDEINKYRMIANNLQTQADTFSRETRKLQDKTNNLTQTNLDLEGKVTELYRQNKLLTIGKTADESKLQEMQMSANDIGESQGMGEMDLIQKSALKMKTVMTSLDALLKGEKSQESYNSLVSKMEDSFNSLKGDINEIKTDQELNKKKEAIKQ